MRLDRTIAAPRGLPETEGGWRILPRCFPTRPIASDYRIALPQRARLR